MEKSVSLSRPEFSRLPWHDATLVSLLWEKEGETVTLKVTFPVGEYRDATLRFLDAQFVRAHIDLGFKRLCTCDINSAYCETDSKWLKELREGDPEVAGYLHFQFNVVPPGGSLEIIAAGVELSWTPSR